MNVLTKLTSEDGTGAASAVPPRSESFASSGIASANGDERRTQMRVYNHWVSLLGTQKFPSIEDLDPEGIPEFQPVGVLLDLTSGIENPGIAYVGQDLAEEAGIDQAITQLRQVPARSVLSQITDHYLQIHANRAPTGFEATFKKRAGTAIDYRGILLPFSSDGETIDFIYGVVTWKEAAPAAIQSPSNLPVNTPLRGSDLVRCLASARADAAKLRTCEERTRGALYRTLGRAHDFAVLAAAQPDDFAELLQDVGITALARAPMVPVVKLVFGAQYDKSRVSEFAASLDHALRLDLKSGSFANYLADTDGGLKSVVAEERRIRRDENGKRPREKAAITNALAERLRACQTSNFTQLDKSGEEFALVLIRRTEAGKIDMVGEVPHDHKLMSRATSKVHKSAEIRTRHQSA